MAGGGWRTSAEIGIDELAGMGEEALAALARAVTRDHDDEHRDASLSWSYSLRQGIWDSAAWPPQIDPNLSDTWAFRACVRSLLAGGLRARLTRTGRFSCSRSKCWWSRKDRFRDMPYSYDLVMRALAWLVANELLDEVRASPFDHLVTGLQSTYGATDLAVQLFPDFQFERVTAYQSIRMRNADRQMIQVPDTEETRRMRAAVDAISEWMSSFAVILPDTLTPYGTGHLTYLNDDGVRCYVRWDGTLRVYRQFCRSSLGCGGRLYGDWQSIPGEWRSGDGGMQIVVAGESFATVEPDFEFQHARMLYARLRIKMPDGFDPYVVGGFHRDYGKLAFHVAVNSRGWVKTVCAIKRASEKRAVKKAKKAKKEGRSLQPEDLPLSFLQSAKLLKAIKEANRPIARAFASDAGVGLQHDDSEILLAVPQALHGRRRAGAPGPRQRHLPEIDEAFVRAAMEAEMVAYEARFQAAVPVGNSQADAVSSEHPPQNPGAVLGSLGSVFGFAKKFGRRPTPQVPVATTARQPAPRPAVEEWSQPTYSELATIFRGIYGPNWLATVESHEAQWARERAFGRCDDCPPIPTLAELRRRESNTKTPQRRKPAAPAKRRIPGHSPRRRHRRAHPGRVPRLRPPPGRLTTLKRIPT